METTINDMVFEWDEEKNKINLRKHGIDFSDATQVFFDENRIERRDKYHSGEEERWQVIGMVNEILFVVYTDREDRTRIISARKAKPKERRIYYGNSDVYFA